MSGRVAGGVRQLRHDLAAHEKRAWAVLTESGHSADEVNAAINGMAEPLQRFIPEGDEYKASWYALRTLMAIREIVRALDSAASDDEEERIAVFLRLGQSYAQGLIGLEFPDLKSFVDSKEGRETAAFRHRENRDAEARSKEFAEVFWLESPDARMGECAEHVRKLLLGQGISRDIKTVRRWIGSGAPASARRPGAPKKHP